MLDGALENAVPWPTGPDSPALQVALADQLALVLAGEKEPEKAIADAHAAWTQVLGA